MAHKVFNISRNEPESQRFTENLQRHRELLLEASRELKKATRAKSEFAAKLSHEFRATLNIIIGFTELLLDEVPGAINEDQRRSLEDILASSKRMLKLVNDYLEQPDPEREKVIQTAPKAR
jgi:signal transduction histidine kinase